MSVRDPGLQPERTALAWQRTALSAAVVAILLLRGGLSRGSAFDTAAGVCAVFALGVAGWMGRRPGTRGARPRALLVMTAALCATGLLAASAQLVG